MQIIYLDNIRGFREAVIPIPPVTFLVGENSSGKSTVLSVIHLMNRFHFGEPMEFDDEKHGMGGFTNIVTKSRTKNPTFTIGSSRIFIGPNSKPSWGYIFLSFCSVEGLPEPYHYTFCIPGFCISVKRQAGSVYVRCLKQSPEFTDQSEAPEMISRIAAIHKSESEWQEVPDVGMYRTSNWPLHAIRDGLNTRNMKADDVIDRLFQLIFRSNEGIWMGPIRCRPRRTYDGSGTRYSESGDHVPYLLRKRLLPGNGKKLESSLCSVGERSGMFDKIAIKQYGDDPEAPFGVYAKFGADFYSITHLGYGVSQILPILTEVIDRPSGTRYYIQQPEVHLHPRAQAEFGTLVHAISSEENKSFAIETHSDYVVDRFRLQIHRTGRYVPSTVLFFERANGRSTVHVIPITKGGKYADDQPDAFRRFFLNEQIGMLDL